MDIKDTLNLLVLQEQVMTLLIKVNTLEDILIGKDIITAEEYSKKLAEKVGLIADKMKPVQDMVENLNKSIKEFEDSKKTNSGDVA